MRRNLSASEAKAQLADALRQAEGGDVVWITRYGKPTAALLGAERLAELERRAAAPPPAPDSPGVSSGGPPEAAGEATPSELRDRAAAASLARIDGDLAKVGDEKLQQVLRLIRANLFTPQIKVQTILDAVGPVSHDITTELKKATGATIGQYLEDRRLETACRLLVDTGLEVQTIAFLVGYSGSRALARAFSKRLGLSPAVYRQLGGRLSPEVARRGKAGLPPLTPRYVAAVTPLAR